MQKDFVGWHEQKVQLQENVTELYFYEREVWWTAIGVNLGFEEDGKWAGHSRPVLILRKFNQHFFLGVPISSARKFGRYYHSFEDSQEYKTALLSQIRALDARRLINKAGLISSRDYAEIRLKLIQLIA